MRKRRSTPSLQSQEEMKYKCLKKTQCQANPEHLLAFKESCRIEENEYAYVEEFQFPTIHASLEKSRSRHRDPKVVYGFGTATGSLGRGMRSHRSPATGQYMCGSLPRVGPRCNGHAPQYYVLDPDALGECRVTANRCDVRRYPRDVVHYDLTIPDQLHCGATLALDSDNER